MKSLLFIVIFVANSNLSHTELKKACKQNLSSVNFLVQVSNQFIFLCRRIIDLYILGNQILIYKYHKKYSFVVYIVQDHLLL